MKLIIISLIVSVVGFAQKAVVPKNEEPDRDEMNDGFEKGDDPSAEEFEKACYNFREGQRMLRDKFRADFANVIEHVESAEVFLLSFSMKEELPKDGILLGYNNDDVVSKGTFMKDRPEEDFKKIPNHFFIEPYGKFSEILERRKVEGDLLEECKKATTELLKAPKGGEGAWCHYPIHGLRLLDRHGFILFQTSICYHCGNYFLRFPDGRINPGYVGFEKSWVGFHGDKLEAFLKRVMPIPKSEMSASRSRLRGEMPVKDRLEDLIFS